MANPTTVNVDLIMSAVPNYETTPIMQDNINGTNLEITLLNEDGSDYIPDGSVTFKAVKSDWGTVLQDSTTGVSVVGNIVTITLHEQVHAKTGLVYYQILVTGGLAVYSQVRYLRVYQGLEEGAIISSNEFTSLANLLVSLEDAETIALAAKELAESTIEEEGRREANEVDRVSAEGLRDEAETARQDAYNELKAVVGIPVSDGAGGFTNGKASNVPIDDTAGNYTAESVEGALAEIGTEITTARGAEVDLNTRLNKMDLATSDIVAELEQLNTNTADIADLKSLSTFYDPYNDGLFTDIYGVEIDFANRTFTRLAGAIGKTPGADFDSILAFGGRRRCNVTNEGKVIAYYGDAGYSETGKLTQAITIGEGENAVTYPVDTIVQVMVEQPKFYYKVVPLKLERVINGKGYHLRKARYYVSDTKLTGFKVHPAFIKDEKERQFIYVSAYEASVFDKSAGTYLLADEQVVDFTAESGDLLASIGNAKPTSGVTQLGATRIGFRRIAANRGDGWSQAYAATVSATQLLLTIEYGSMNSQTALGKGIVDKPSGEETISYADITGATTNLGNASGMAAGTDGLASVTYRGEENFWSNIWTWVDGLNIYNQSDLYVADNGFVDDSSATPYKDAGITLAKTGGCVSAFGYNEEFDWLFFPSETLGNSALPVGDNFYQTTTLNAWRVALLGGSWGYSLIAGAFCWHVGYYAGTRARTIGGRLVYVPN